MACRATPADGQTQTLLEKAASVFSAVPVDASADAPRAQQFTLARDPAFLPAQPSKQQVDKCVRCLTEKLIGLAVVVAVGLTLVGVARAIFRKGAR